MMNELINFVKENKSIVGTVTGFVAGTVVTALVNSNKSKKVEKKTKEEQDILTAYMSMRGFGELLENCAERRHEIISRLESGELSKPQKEALGRELASLDQEEGKIRQAKNLFYEIQNRD